MADNEIKNPLDGPKAKATIFTDLRRLTMAYDAETPKGVNVANILALADYIEKMPPEQFDMNSLGHNTRCGTAACIAGWAMHCAAPDLFQDYIMKSPVQLRPDNFAQEYLGLDDEQARDLFALCQRYYGDLEFLTARRAVPAQAARTLRHLAATGDVKWVF